MNKTRFRVLTKLTQARHNLKRKAYLSISRASICYTPDSAPYDRIHRADLPFSFTVCSQACPALAIFLFSKAIRDWACFSPLRWPSMTRTLEPGDLHKSHDSGLLKALPIFLKSINFSWCLRLLQCCLRWNSVAKANVQAWQTSTEGWFLNTWQLEEEACCSGKPWKVLVGSFLFNPSWLWGGPYNVKWGYETEY